MGFGAFPSSGGGVAAGAVFPLDLYFDVKQSLAFGSGWAWVIAAVMLAVLVRGAVLAGTLWLAEDAPGPFILAWGRVCRLEVIAALALFPSACFFFIGAAIRYAPFIWVGAILGVIPAILLLRRAARLDVGSGAPRGRGVPEAPTFLTYAYLLSAVAAAMSVLSRSSPWASAALIVCLGPLHALFLLGWREHLRDETYPGGGTLSAAVTSLVIAGLLGASLYDRYIRDAQPVGTVTDEGSLLLIGGVDSTSTTGALIDIDARDLGFARESSELLSYAGDNRRYGAADTRGDLDRAASAMADQIASADRPRYVLGHSQASVIIDKIVLMGLPLPERVVVLAPSLPRPPAVEVPAPDQQQPGKPGGDVARAVAGALDGIGLSSFDVDVPASPTNVEPSLVTDPAIPRLAVWALGDSVWLEGDWRRPGETNVVAMTDHVGVTNNGYAVSSARDFFAGREVEDDETSFQGFVVTALRYAFEPWRPD